MACDLTSESKLWHIWVLCQQRNLQHASPSQWMHSGMQTRQSGVMRGKSLNSHKLLRNAIHSQTAQHNNKLLKAYLAADMTGVLWWLRTAGGWCLSNERVRKRRWKKKERQVIFRDREVRKILELRMRQGRVGRKPGKDASNTGPALQGQKHSYFTTRGFRAQRRFSVTFSFSGFLKIRS